MSSEKFIVFLNLQSKFLINPKIISNDIRMRATSNYCSTKELLPKINTKLSDVLFTIKDVRQNLAIDHKHLSRSFRNNTAVIEKNSEQLSFDIMETISYNYRL